MILADSQMARTLTYNEMKQTVSELEKDLLAYKSAKEDAVKAKEELALIFNAIPDHIAVIDSQYRIQRVNKSLADKLKGYLYHDRFWTGTFQTAWTKFGHQQYSAQDLQLFLCLLPGRKNTPDAGRALSVL